MENPCEDGCIVSPVCSENCEKKIEYKRFLQSELIKEIVKDDPDVIGIEGSTDPSCASNSFYYYLIDFGERLVQIGNDIEFRLITTTKNGWIEKTIPYIHPNYELRKIGDRYYIGESAGCDIYEKEYIRTGLFSIDYGGIIWRNRTDTLK
jgi:hypothetical protein